MSFNDAQIAQLLKPIAPQRVLQDGKGHSHVSQQDVTAHLIRMFGFGNFDTEVLNVELVFERPTLSISKGKKEPDPNRYDVCYRALLRLTIRDEHGNKLCSYEDGSTATAQNQTQGDGHDLAYKSAISLAKKRCAINLGDQFGLSLYNKGQTKALVLGTLVGAGDAPEDVQADVPQQVAMGNDETDYEPEARSGAQPGRMSEASEGMWGTEMPGEAVDAADQFAELSELIAGVSTKAELAEIGQRVASSTLSGEGREQLRVMYSARVAALKEAS